MRFEDRISEKYKTTGDITTLQLNITEKCNLRFCRLFYENSYH